MLRETRLGRLPPALFAAEILVEAGFPVLAFEYGGKGRVGKIPGKIPRLRFYPRAASILPPRLRSPFVWLATFLYLTAKFLWRGRPALMVTNGLSEQVLALCLHRIYGVPYVCHLHEIFEENEVSAFNRLLFRAERSVIGSAAFAMCPEENRAEIFRSRYGGSTPIHFVPNCPRKVLPLDVFPVREKLGLSQEATLVLYMGGIGRNIPLCDLFSAMADFPHVHALLAGWGDSDWLASLKDFASDCGVVDRVHFLGPVENRFAYFRAADIGFCLYRPSELRTRNAATASNKLFESMATGKPVMVRDTPDFQRIVDENECGVVCDVSAEGIRSALSALSHATRRQEMGANGRRAFLSRYHYENYFLPLLPAFRSAARFGLEVPADTSMDLT